MPVSDRGCATTYPNSKIIPTRTRRDYEFRLKVHCPDVGFFDTSALVFPPVGEVLRRFN